VSLEFNVRLVFAKMDAVFRLGAPVQASSRVVPFLPDYLSVEMTYSKLVSSAMMAIQVTETDVIWVVVQNFSHQGHYAKKMHNVHRIFV
jgi:hypothetical protein